LPAGTNESTLEIARWDGTAWQILSGQVDTVANEVRATITGFQRFCHTGPGGSTYRDADSDADNNTNGNAYSYTYCDSYRHTYGNSYGDSNTYIDLYTDYTHNYGAPHFNRR